MLLCCCSQVRDIHAVLEVTVYDEDKDKKVEFLGKVAIPLLKVSQKFQVHVHALCGFSIWTPKIYLFMKAAGLNNANCESLPSYPTRRPRLELDFILHSDGIDITHFEIPQVPYSDHLPLICDFEVKR